ncbi:dienelactone hydrolase family protein [Chitinibacter bivalviorum]|uniref:Dienelactone hydrolase family protein n=1 Tax=Chitinibacter bivalviorum TaxID=2739434 RepID=A0A7H9BEN3_9NEIS|nr:dienelactone hydrolase family protein [Chitinibacter bivalviorum]QLG87190.1 dienelactone hydrolase family protein [Chitinibacter bivalviorum]
MANSVSMSVGKARLNGEYFAAPKAPAPAVVLLPGCGGLYAKDKQPAVRYARMASQLQELGFAVLMLNPERSITLKNRCQVSNIQQQKKEMKRRANEAQLAITWLKARRDIDSNRIAVVGWDNGASAALSLLNRTNPGVRSAVVFYPNCRLLLGADFRVAAPTILLTGERDTLTPYAQCTELSRISGQSLFHLVSYPNARHDFDLMLDHLEDEALNLPKNHLALDVIAESDSAQDAWRRTYKWLSRWFDPERSMEGVPPRNLQ